MKRKILSYLLGWIFVVLIWVWLLWWSYVNAECISGCFDDDWTCLDICPAVVTADKCNWIKLNTNFPIIWNCIKTKWDSTNATNAFPTMIWAITKIIMSVILVVCFIMIIVAWIMRAADNPKWAKWLLKKVAITIILLWLSWVILKLVNPNFFG